VNTKVFVCRIAGDPDEGKPFRHWHIFRDGHPADLGAGINKTGISY
jgi:hypothetical protein